MAVSLTYDTGALIAAERSDGFLWALHDEALRAGMLPTVPSSVLAQAWRGGPQARLSQLLKGCEIESLGEARARSVGSLCARTDTTDIVDASVVVGAGIRGDAIVTSDRSDLQLLASMLAMPIDIVDV